MMKLLLFCLIVPLLAMLSGFAQALSFGEAKALSTQGQALQVRVVLNDTRGHELFDLDVEQILGVKARELGFADAALDPSYRVEVMSNGRGELWVDISSREPFHEPYAEFLLQLDSADERLLSEYRVSVPAQPRQQGYLIKAGDSLGRIAQTIRPDEAIQLQAIVRYLHVNNLQAFAQGDINRIVVGARLNLPSASDYSAMPRRRLSSAQTSKPAKALDDALPLDVALINTDVGGNSAQAAYAVAPVSGVARAKDEPDSDSVIDSDVQSEIKSDLGSDNDTDSVAKLEWVELGAVIAADDIGKGSELSPANPTSESAGSSTGSSAAMDSEPVAEIADETTTEVVAKAATESAIDAVTANSLPQNVVQNKVLGRFGVSLWWLLIPAVLIALAAVFLARHYWRFAKPQPPVKPAPRCEKTARVLALEKKLASQQAYKKTQAEKQRAARQRVLELEEKLANIQRNKQHGSNNSVAAEKPQKIVIEPNTELTQVKAREDLSVRPANAHAKRQSEPVPNALKKSLPSVEAVSANDALIQSPRERDADDEKIIDDFYKHLDHD